MSENARFGTILVTHPSTGTRHIVSETLEADGEGPVEVFGEHTTLCGRTVEGYAYSDPWLETNLGWFGKSPAGECQHCARLGPEEDNTQ